MNLALVTTTTCTVAALLACAVAILARRQKKGASSRWLPHIELWAAVAASLAAAIGAVSSCAKERDDETAHANEQRQRKERQVVEDARFSDVSQRLQESEAREQASLKACVDALAEGRSANTFLNGLNASQREGLKDHRCGQFPAWHKGAAQVRLFTSSRAEVVQEVRNHLLKDVLFHTPEQNWSSHVTEVTSSLPTDRSKRDHIVYLIALNQVQANLAGSICSRLQCAGVDPGAEACGLRDIESVLAIPAAE